MLTITSLRLRRNRRGVSNIIVVVLSLVIIVAIISNIVLWNYEMNQLDWEKMKEDTGITNVERVNSSSWFTAQSEYTVNTGNRINGTYTDTQTVNNQYERFTEASTTSSYNPSGYNLVGSTTYGSGSLSDLQSSNNVYMTFNSYQYTAAQTLYAHKETTSIGGTSYYNLSLNSADASGLTLTALMNGPRTLFGKSVYSLRGVSTIPASTWTMYYRAWKDANQSITYDAPSSYTFTGGSSTFSWTHTTGTGNNRLLVVTVSTYASGGPIPPVTVSRVTYGGVTITHNVTAAYTSIFNPQARSYIFYLINPASGSNTISVTMSGSSYAVGGAVSYAGVDQTTPIQTQNTAKNYGSSQSVSVTVTGNGRAVYGSLACYRTSSSYSISYISGQNHRWNQTSQYYKGAGDDELNVAPGSVSIGWTTNYNVGYVCCAIAINPATPAVGHVDIDVLVRKSDNTVRSTIGSNVALSSSLTTSATTLSGNYSWSSYTVVAQTDYLEVDFYVDVSTPCQGTNANLMIDGNTLAIASQTRATNIMLPMYSAGVEFTGTSNTATWTQLVWTVVSCWTIANVNVTLQVYNYTSGSYPTSGNGYISYISSATPNTEETKTQSITTNSIQFRNGSSNWKIKVTGVKATTTQFNFKADWIEFKTNYYALDITGTSTLDISTYPLVYIQTIEIQLRYRASDAGEKWYLKAYNWSSSTYSNSGFNSTAGQTPTTGWDYYAVNLTNKWRSYVQNNGTIHAEFVDKNPDSTQTTVDIDFLGVRAEIDGTRFTFKNDGALTAHLVSLWITNSTSHRRYDINIFMNSADTTTYLRADISLPAGQFIVKVVTERGNIAVYSGS